MTPIDYEYLDTPTWLRERRALFLARHNHPPSSLQSGDYRLQLEMLADLFTEDYIWRWPKRIMDPRLWREQMMGTWEVHDESHVMTQAQYDAITRRAKRDENRFPIR